jgi:hypothetical protein
LRAALRQPKAAHEQARVAGRDFAAEAHALAKRGETLEASHLMLLATLARMGRARIIELRPEDSNRRICTKLRDAKLPTPYGDELVRLIGETDAAWFGHRHGGDALYQRWRATYAALAESAA